MQMKQAVILSAARTAVGRFGGTLSAVTDRALAGLVIKEAIKRAGISPEAVQELIFSQQYRTGELPPNMAQIGRASCRERVS
jgi:acetyl-CoA C-acetyltransferase